MAEMTIRLQCDPATGKKEIIIALRSDDDSLPQEHEQLHKALVDKLIEGGVVKAGEIGKITIERETDEGVAAPATRTPEAERRAEREGS